MYFAVLYLKQVQSDSKPFREGTVLLSLYQKPSWVLLVIAIPSGKYTSVSALDVF